MTVECIDNYQPSSEGRKPTTPISLTENNEFGLLKR
jgi:hypothetical protein